MITLDAHLDAARGPDDGVAALVRAMAEAGVRIADELARAALIGQLGTTGETNVQGEKVKKLDVWANDVLVAALDATRRACTLVSEEMEEIRHDGARCAGTGFVVCFDPVDGSSNLDVNGILDGVLSGNDVNVDPDVDTDTSVETDTSTESSGDRVGGGLLDVLF